MIKEKQVNVKIGSWNHKHYKDLGYSGVVKGAFILVNVEDLTHSSHTLITAICDSCGSEYEMSYKTYNTRIKITNKYSCKKCCYDVMKISLKKKYGVENVSFIPEVKEKIRIKNIENTEKRKIKRVKTNLERYGVENTFQNKNIINENLIKTRKTNILNGRWIDDSLLTPWIRYKKNVMRLTYKYKKVLYNNWDGYDYYDNEYIKENYNLHYYHPDYPTIDHKISIKYGFDNNIPIEEISDINNLCFTKKKLNTRKYTKNECDFKLNVNSYN